MDNNNNNKIYSESGFTERLENDHPATILVIILPLFFLAIFISFLLIALSKSEEKRENIKRIITYTLIQFLCLPFLIIFVILNLVLICLSFLCFKKLNYLSSKKTFEYCKGLFGYFSKKDITTIKIGKNTHNIHNPARSDNYNDVNNNSKSNDNPLHLNKFSDNLNLNKNLNVNNLNDSNSISNNRNTNNKKDNNKNNFLMNDNKISNNNEKLNVRTTAVAISNLNDLESNLHCENDKEKNLSGFEQLNKESNINNNIPHYNIESNLGKSESINDKNNNLNPNMKRENIENHSNLNNNKVNIFMSMNDARPQPVNKKVHKNKIMDFLSEVLVNKDNTPSYINLFKNIKDKSKEKLEKRDENSVVIFHK